MLRAIYRFRDRLLMRDLAGRDRASAEAILLRASAIAYLIVFAITSWEATPGPLGRPRLLVLVGLRCGGRRVHRSPTAGQDRRTTDGDRGATAHDHRARSA